MKLRERSFAKVIQMLYQKLFVRLTIKTVLACIVAAFPGSSVEPLCQQVACASPSAGTFNCMSTQQVRQTRDQITRNSGALP